ncbi:hypothetical protein [Celeribacter arenosi]|uniref:Hemolysin-type calcium-binding repeat-containing protein n=1 Tax=Celeribacter arenosi TaxID=792649 RepID=A0ABP7K123_9RHOB
MEFGLFFLPALIGIGLLWLFSGDDIPTVEVSEGEDFNGTDAAEHIIGTDVGDMISAGGGFDIVDGNGGDDIIFGNAGNDTLNGGDGNDAIEGGFGDDLIDLGDGDDVSGSAYDEEDVFVGNYRQTGDDRIYGGDGDDVIVDQNGSNVIDGGNGNDEIAALDAQDTDAADIIDAGAGADFVLADDGDTVTLGTGADQIAGLVTDRDDVITVTDFDPAEDAIELIWQGTGHDETLVELFEVAGGLMLHFDGQDIMFLEGLGAADIPFITYTRVGFY